MAKKQSSSGNTDWFKVAGFLSFFSIIISGTIFLISGIMNLVGASVDLGIFSSIASLFLIVSVTLSGWMFLTKAKLPAKTVWVVLFWVFVLLAIFGTFSVAF
ncbi:MAG: hypothetical protein ACRC5M_03745 [Anaeroplasmataceae bacterium]